MAGLARERHGILKKAGDQYLLRGHIWVDADTYLLRRSEGEPANKSPSWWLRNVRIELVYGDVGGMWLQTASEATVNVRIFGQYTMVTRDLEYKIGDPSALGPTPESPGLSNIDHVCEQKWTDTQRPRLYKYRLLEKCGSCCWPCTWHEVSLMR